MSKIGDYFASQCGNPHGVIGKIMTWAMNRANNVMYKGIVDELKISPKTRILDVGFGNGYLETLIIQKSRCFITRVPATSATHSAVAVAMPLICWSKFRAVRSPVRRVLVLPFIRARMSPF